MFHLLESAPRRSLWCSFSFSAMRVFPRREASRSACGHRGLPCSAVSLTAITACRNCANSNCYLASKSDRYALSAAGLTSPSLFLGLFVRPRRLLSDFSPAGFNLRNTFAPRVYHDHAAPGPGRMRGARNELPWSVNYALSLPIGNNAPHGLLIAGWIIRKRRRPEILPLPWTLYWSWC